MLYDYTYFLLSYKIGPGKVVPTPDSRKYSFPKTRRNAGAFEVRICFALSDKKLQSMHFFALCSVVRILLFILQIR